MKERYAWLRSACMILFLIVGGYLLLVYCLVPALSVLLPFALAWGLAFAVRPLAYAIARRTIIPQKVIGVCLTILAFLLLGGGVFLLFSRLFKELLNFLRHLTENPETISSIFSRVRAIFGGLLPEGDGSGKLASLLEKASGEALSVLTGYIAGGLARLPGLLLFLLVTVIASVYFALDLGGINHAVLSHLPERGRERLLALKGRIARGAVLYVRAYSILFVVTLGLLLLGFLILRVKYALLFAVLFAFLDLLPVIGVGTMLVPWGVFCLLTGNAWQGVCLLVLWLVVMVVHEVLEPHLLAGELGLHPLFVLFSICAGVRLFGVAGIFLGPPLTAILAPLLLKKGDALPRAK